MPALLNLDLDRFQEEPLEMPAIVRGPEDRKDRRSLTRTARTSCEEIREARIRSMVRSVRNLIAISTDDLRRIDAGKYDVTRRTRAYIEAELRQYHNWLADISANAPNVGI